jgi:hypothetical protein
MPGDVPFKVGQRSLDQVGIEMTSSAPANFLRSNLERNRSVVRPLVDHGIDGIDDGENARTEWNVLPGNSAGVAAAVEFSWWECTSSAVLRNSTPLRNSKP